MEAVGVDIKNINHHFPPGGVLISQTPWFNVHSQELIDDHSCHFPLGNFAPGSSGGGSELWSDDECNVRSDDESRLVPGLERTLCLRGLSTLGSSMPQPSPRTQQGKGLTLLKVQKHLTDTVYSTWGGSMLQNLPLHGP